MQRTHEHPTHHASKLQLDKNQDTNDNLHIEIPTEHSYMLLFYSKVSRLDEPNYPTQGEPIGDSDCYELFDYDTETSIIKLYNDYDDMSMELEVLDYSDYHLLLKMDGEV